MSVRLHISFCTISTSCSSPLLPCVLGRKVCPGRLAPRYKLRACICVYPYVCAAFRTIECGAMRIHTMLKGTNHKRYKILPINEHVMVRTFCGWCPMLQMLCIINNTSRNEPYLAVEDLRIRRDSLVEQGISKSNARHSAFIIRTWKYPRQVLVTYQDICSSEHSPNTIHRRRECGVPNPLLPASLLRQEQLARRLSAT